MLTKNNNNATALTKDNSCNINGREHRVQIWIKKADVENSRFSNIFKPKIAKWCVLLQWEKKLDSIQNGTSLCGWISI